MLIVSSCSPMAGLKDRIEREAKLKLARIKFWQGTRRILWRGFDRAFGIFELGYVFSRFLARSRCKNAYGHKVRMRSFPRKCGFLGFEKAINDNGILLRRGSPTSTGRRTADDRRAAINRKAHRVGKLDVAAVWNSFWIDRAMSGLQPRAIGTRAKLALARPVNGDSRKQRTFRSKNRPRDQ